MSFGDTPKAGEAFRTYWMERIREDQEYSRSLPHEIYGCRCGAAGQIGQGGQPPRMIVVVDSSSLTFSADRSRQPRGTFITGVLL
jgi:hypothetical protein